MKLQEQADKMIAVCCGKDCKKKEAKKLYKSLATHLKKEGKSQKVLLMKAQCLDYCNHAPVVAIDGDLFTEAKLDKIKKEL